jgi:hypothetical protein
MDLSPDRIRDIGDRPDHLRRKGLFVGRPHLSWCRSPQHRNRRVRPSSTRDPPEQG